MTSTPELDAIGLRRTAAPGSRLLLLLYGLAGFSGLLTEQSFAKYYELAAGATMATAATAVAVSFLGFAIGAVTIARLLRGGHIARPLLAFGLAQMALGIVCVAGSYIDYPALGTLSGLLLLLPGVLLGAGFPLIAATLRQRWAEAYAANLCGALVGALLGPLVVMPVAGLRGAMWLGGIIGVALWAISAKLPAEIHQTNPLPSSPLEGENQVTLAGCFGAGALVAALACIWMHLAGVVLGESVFAGAWTAAAVVLGLWVGALSVDRAHRAGWRIRTSLLFQVSALLLMVQFALWDRVPGLFRFSPMGIFRDSFYLAEFFKLLVMVLMVSPVAAILGTFYPRQLAHSALQEEDNSLLAGYMSAAHALGCVTGALLGVFLLVPWLGAEISLKSMVIGLASYWVVLRAREPLTRKQAGGAFLVALVLLAVTLGRWWHWGSLTAGNGNSLGRVAQENSDGTRFLPASFLFRHEAMEGGFTTVIEQTAVLGGVGRTVRTLYRDGVLAGDDAAPAVSFAPSPPDGRALLIGLGTGRTALALQQAGYREISVAEPLPGMVQAVQQYFSGPPMRLYLNDGRHVLASERATFYDLIAVEGTHLWIAGVTDLYSREFYQLAHSRLRPGGMLQQAILLDHLGARELASVLATAREAFQRVGLWRLAGQDVLVASDGTLRPPEGADLLMDPAGVAGWVANLNPPVNTDQNRWLEYAAR
jgi:SAM-dependent methyltransferase